VTRFSTPDSYAPAPESGYRLLPFRFARLDSERYLLTNEAGEPAIVPVETLRALVGHTLSPSAAEYLDLKASHFLQDDSSTLAPELLALKVRTKLRRLAEFTSLHLFVVTLRCEHACPYCQVSRQSDDRVAFDMSTEIADRALDLAFRSPAAALKLEFQGGEPLLNFPLIQHLVLSAEQRNRSAGKDIAYVITTNLALLDDSVLEFCAAHGIIISTSLDGPRELHNSNRPRPGGDSYQRVVSGIERARAALGRDRVGALMTTTSASLSRARDIVDEYVRLGFEEIFLRPLSPYGFAVKTRSYSAYDVDRWLEFYFEGLDYIIDLNRAGVPIVERYAATVLAKMLSPFQPGYVDLMTPAGIGIAAVVYNYDGDVYASDESRMLAEMGDRSFRLGNVLTDSYESIFTSDALLTALDASFAASAPMCSDCAFLRWCGSDPVFHHATQGDLVGRKPTSGFCRRNMGIFRGLVTRFFSQDGERKAILERWAFL